MNDIFLLVESGCGLIKGLLEVAVWVVKVCDDRRKDGICRWKG